MATKNIVPRADQEGGLGTAAKSWGKLFIENASAGGTAAATISNLDVDQVALDINTSNTTANIIDIDATSLTSAFALSMDLNSLTTGGGIFIDVDDASTGSAFKRLQFVSYTKPNNSINGAANNVIGHSITAFDTASTNHAGSTHARTGYNSAIGFVNNNGTHIIDGFSSDINLSTGSPASAHPGGIQSFYSNVSDGQGFDFKSVSSADTGDQFTIATTTHGATTLTTTDDDAAAAHLTLAADGNIVQNSVGWDVNSTGTATLDAQNVSIDSVNDANVSVTGAGQTLALHALGGGASIVSLSSAGNTSSSIDIDSAAGGIDVDAAKAITLTTTGATGDISLVSAHTAGVAFHIDANADAASEVQIDAGILDIDVTAAATLDAVGVAIGAGSGELDLTTTGTMDINSAALDVDATGAINIQATGAANDIYIGTEHTAGTAFHIDANAHEDSVVDIDAGHLDIDSIGATTITSGTTVDIEGTVLTLDCSTSIQLEGATKVTGALETTGVIELGHASDTTLARASAAVATLEGRYIDTHSLTIKVLPNEFKNNPDSGRPAMVHDAVSNTLSVRGHAATDDFYAFVKIPTYFKVTHVQVHASSNVVNGASITSFNYQTGSTNAVAGTLANFNTNQAITNIPASGTQDLVIKCTPGANTIFVYGATVTLALI